MGDSREPVAALYVRPHSNAHGPNEFLDIEYAKKLTAAVAEVLAAQAMAA